MSPQWTYDVIWMQDKKYYNVICIDCSCTCRLAQSWPWPSLVNNNHKYQFLTTGHSWQSVKESVTFTRWYFPSIFYHLFQVRFIPLLRVWCHENIEMQVLNNSVVVWQNLVVVSWKPMNTFESLRLCQECCARSRYQWQGQVITSHRYCGM